MAGGRRGYEFPQTATPPNSDGVFVVLTFSGGGTRAAALSFGVLEQMVDDSICVDGQRKSAADEVDLISAVSGGSFTAAYFALRGKVGFPAFERRFLYYGSQAELGVRWLMPEKLLHVLASQQYGRTDVAAELWDDQLFHGATLGDLARRGHPYVFINATDMDAGAVFSFTGEQLRALCIAADSFSIARAVAASSAVPGALSPLTLRNRAAGQPCAVPPAWTTAALRMDPSSEGHRHAASLRAYSDRRRPYVHLLDGGLVDNTGARVPLRLLTTRGEDASILDRLESGRAATVLFVVVDAQVAGDSSLGRNAESPSVPTALSRGVDIALATTSTDVIRLLRGAVGAANTRYGTPRPDWDCSARAEADRAPVLCMAEVAFRNVADDSTRARLNRLSTSLQLPRADVDLLRASGRSLLRDQRAYQTLLARYGGACQE